MTKLILIILLFPFWVDGQSKEEILKAIIDINRLETEDHGPFLLYTNFISYDFKKELLEIPNKSNNYKNFQALRNLINKKELVALTQHENGVVRLFAIRQLLLERDSTFDFFNSFMYEFNRSDTIVSQYADMIDLSITYYILLEDLSGDWNYARSTNAAKDLQFFTRISRPIDSFLLFSNFNPPDIVYEGIFDRHNFGELAISRILELIKNNYNFWAFNYLKKNEPKLYESIEEETVSAFEKNKKQLLKEHPNFFEWFMRYLVESNQYEVAKSFIQELKDENYSQATIDGMLMGIDQKFLNRLK